MTVTQKVIQELSKLPRNRQQQVLDYVVSLGVQKKKSAKTKPSTNGNHDPLDQTSLGRLAKRVRLSNGPKLPSDFASQVDHYAYGVAKR
ncbi:MAG TPA: hypothetical protein PLN21_19470 [Gemmatales bacterium]|nr:hypothetical protein [Gemmatales bacterium]